MRQSGFSLLELSIVLTIVAIVIAGGLTLGTASVQQQEIKRTWDEMKVIDDALSVFVRENGRMPCPASISLDRSNALFGREATDCSDSTPPAGLVRVEYPASSGKYVRIGGVPFYSLGLPDEYLADDWGGRYLYAVSESFITSATSTSTGNIRIVDDGGTAISSEIAWVLVSHGRTRTGAYAAKSGTQIVTCASSTLDAENCDNDGIFRDAAFNNGTVVSSFFDDFVRWETRALLFNIQAFASP